jgi:beta-N-acetylhexosaminidase
MSLSRRLGQFVIVGFDGHTVPVELRSMARQFDLGGVILFARNVQAPEQVAELSHDLRQLAGDVPMWISIDQEGGRVARLRAPFAEWPPMATLGRSGKRDLAARFAGALAEQLAVLGISLDYSPVLDVHTNAANPVIGDRALATDAAVVADLGEAIVRQLQALGVAACGKHFPGHGDTSTDSHRELPLVEHPPDRLRRVEFVPFKRAIEAEVASIMTAHLLVPAFDGSRPASLSRTIVDGVLRGELGFEGLILTDDLGMQGCAAQYPVEQAIVEAVAAGSDAVLLCGPDHNQQVVALEALVRAAEGGTIPYTQLDDSLARHRRIKERFLKPSWPLDPAWRPPSSSALRAVVESGAHRAIADEMGQYL